MRGIRTFVYGDSNFRVDRFELSCNGVEMKASNVEIAKAALCSETAVRGAIQRGKLDPDNLESVLGWVIAMRFKELGLGGLDDPIERLKGIGALKPASELVTSSPSDKPGLVDVRQFVEMDTSELHYERDFDQEEPEVE